MTTRRIRLKCRLYILVVVVVFVWVHSLAVRFEAAASSNSVFHLSPSSSPSLNIFETLPHQVIRVIRVHQWRSDLICQAWVGVLSSLDESFVTPSDSLTTAAWYHPPHPHRWQYQQQFELNQANTIIQLHLPYHHHHHQSPPTQELTSFFPTSSGRRWTKAELKWLIQVACQERTRLDHVKRVPIEPSHGILTHDHPDADSILHFLLTPSSSPATTSSLDSALRLCPAPPKWLITFREWWLENWRELYDEMMEWKWLQGWWIVKEALTASVTRQKEYQEWLTQVLPHQAFISIYTFMRELLHDLKCFVYFLLSFIDAILPSASTLRFVFQLAFLHVIALAYLLYRHQYPSQPQQNLEAPSVADSEDHKDEERKEGGARLGSWSRNLQTWKEPLAAWMDERKAPTPTTASFSSSIIQPPETAADQIRRRMREEAESEETERRSTLSSLIQTSSSTTDSSTVAEAPKISSIPTPTPTPSSSFHPSPSGSQDPFLPRHLSATSHIITPLIPTSPFSATRHLPTTNVPPSLPFGRSILHTPTSSRPSSPSASASSTASTPTSQTNLRPFAFRTPPLPETTTSATEDSTTTTSPSHSTTTAPTEEQYDDLGPNI